MGWYSSAELQEKIVDYIISSNPGVTIGNLLTECMLSSGLFCWWRCANKKQVSLGESEMSSMNILGDPLTRVFLTEFKNKIGNIDNTKPVITLIGQSTVHVSVNNTYVDAGATALDNKNGNITSLIETTDNVNTTSEGTYYVKYNVRDTSGNMANEVIRVIQVVSNPRRRIRRHL